MQDSSCDDDLNSETDYESSSESGEPRVRHQPYPRRVRNKSVNWRGSRAILLKTAVQALSLKHRSCNQGECSLPAEYSCHACGSSGCAFFCTQHAGDHATNTIGHDMIDGMGCLRPKELKRLRCDDATGNHPIVLVNEHGWDNVLVSDKSLKSLFEYGFLANSPITPCMLRSLAAH
jgi:hypothetical protein